MRIQMTMIEVDEERWAYLQANVQAEYEIPEDATRVCLTFSYGEEERHVEMPLGSTMGLLMGLGMVGVTREMRNALAKLRPVAADLVNLINTPCEHDSPVVSFTPSQFDDAPPVRRHKDGCQSYGPYTKPEAETNPIARLMQRGVPSEFNPGKER